MRSIVLLTALLAAAPAAAQTFPLTMPDICRMGECARNRFLERIEIARSGEGVLYRVPVERWTGPEGRLRRQRDWQVFVFCSTARPAYLFRYPDEPNGRWIAHVLSPGHPAGVFGYNTSSHTDYNAICHGIPAATGPRVRGLARRHGYPAALVDRVEQFELAAPEDILRAR